MRDTFSAEDLIGKDQIYTLIPSPTFQSDFLRAYELRLGI